LFCENYTHVTLVSQIVLQVGLNKRKFIYWFRPMSMKLDY
jgi:hypothetical protein